MNGDYIAQGTLENDILVRLEPLGGGLADLRVDFPRTSHPSISPDGRTILFDNRMDSGLFAAYLDESGVWSKPVRLSEHGLSAIAGIANYSPDGKYVFFQDAGDIYWIGSKFVERLRPDKAGTSQ
jgi:Tol biopolymer transport system component